MPFNIITTYTQLQLSWGTIYIYYNKFIVYVFTFVFVFMVNRFEYRFYKLGLAIGLSIKNYQLKINLGNFAIWLRSCLLRFFLNDLVLWQSNRFVKKNPKNVWKLLKQKLSINYIFQSNNIICWKTSFKHQNLDWYLKCFIDKEKTQSKHFLIILFMWIHSNV